MLKVEIQQSSAYPDHFDEKFHMYELKTAESTVLHNISLSQ